MLRGVIKPILTIRSLPTLLVVEMRSAFKACARQHQRSTTRLFSTVPQRYRQGPHPPKGGSKQPQWPYNGALTPQKPAQAQNIQRDDGRDQKNETELVPQQKEQTALDTGRRVPVPMRAIPQAQITPNLKLSPRERLHIEVLTRQQPRQQEKRIYRERLQIYHIGNFREVVLAIGKGSCVFCACLVTFVFAPAHVTAGTSLWIVALIWLGGLVPGVVFNYMTKPMISRIFLNLPTKARETSKAAMEYARNLPGDADLDIRYLKPWGLERAIKARLSEFEPTQGNILRPLTFKWKNRLLKNRPSSISTPTSFYVDSKTASGAASTNTIPGIWDRVYKQLVGGGQASPMAKWEKPGSGMSVR